MNDSESEIVEPTVSHAKAHEAFGIVLQWLEAQGADADHLLLVTNWMSTAAKKRQDSLPQSKVSLFFMAM